VSQFGIGNWELGTASVVAAVFALVLLAAGPLSSATATWTSPMHYRVLITVDPRAVTRTNSPASIDVDLPQALTSMGGAGSFDESTIEVTGYDAAGLPRVFDSSRAGYEKYLLPWRIQKYYPISRVTLSFVMPDQTCTQYAVYFDTVESGLGMPVRHVRRHGR